MKTAHSAMKELEARIINLASRFEVLGWSAKTLSNTVEKLVDNARKARLLED